MLTILDDPLIVMSIVLLCCVDYNKPTVSYCYIYLLMASLSEEQNLCTNHILIVGRWEADGRMEQLNRDEALRR